MEEERRNEGSRTTTIRLEKEGGGTN